MHLRTPVEPRGGNEVFFRPFSDSGGFPAVVGFHFPVDIIGNGSLFAVPFSTLQSRHVIKTEAGEFKLLRSQERSCRSVF